MRFAMGHVKLKENAPSEAEREWKKENAILRLCVMMNAEGVRLVGRPTTPGLRCTQRRQWQTRDISRRGESPRTVTYETASCPA